MTHNELKNVMIHLLNAANALRSGTPHSTNGVAWFEKAIESVPSMRGGSPGTTTMPYYSHFILNETLWVPNRHSIIGHPEIEHIRDHYGFWVGKAMSGYAIQNERAPNNKRGNGNFDCWLKRFFLKCNNKSDGINWFGAQVSGLERVTIHDAREVALKVGFGSCRFTVRDCDIRNGASSENARDPKVARGVGILARAVQGCVVDNTHFHHCQKSFNIDESHALVVTGGCHENCVTPVRVTGKSSDIHMVGQRFERCGTHPIDLTGAGGGIEIKGSVYGAESDELFFIDQEGNNQVLCRGAKKRAHFHIAGRHLARRQ